VNSKPVETENQFLSSLNSEQKEAVLSTNGPLLVLAGAGTGKTKVLTTRIAHILTQRMAMPSQILAVTFTNKAAREMRDRLQNTVDFPIDGIWLGTFHSIAAKILRRHAESLGYTKDFTIIDPDDQLRLTKQIFKDLNIDDKKNPPKLFLYLIGRFKDKALGPEHISSDDQHHFAGGMLIQLYREYQSRLKKLNAMDFGDLLMNNIVLLRQDEDVHQQYMNKFKYILVDEYQDTNSCQYTWLKMLAQDRNNICCVGDDDQSIYGWRGAEVTNILRFDKDFPNAKIIRLERNYRSTNHILEAASGIIEFNKERHGKKLWTEKEDGNKVKLNSFYDEQEEARYIAEEIEALQQLQKHSLNEIAILVRAGYQTRSFEESLNFLRIPYRIVGGFKFYERTEIKDTLAYIRVLVNRDDSLAFERIINTPKRGVGNATLQEIHLLARNNNIPLIEAAEHLINNQQIKGKQALAISKLITNFNLWRQQLNEIPHWQIVENMLIEVGYIEMWKNEGTEDAKERVDNIKELIRALEEYNDLSEYLEHVSLISDADNISEDNKVNVMTMHAAKGLEFDTVFLPGWEEGIFPSQKAIDENGKTAIEEERRLAYVGITRAKQNLYISHASNRRIYGSYQTSLPSRFIDELPEQHYEIVNNFGLNYKTYKTISTPAPLSSSSDNDNKRSGDRVFHIKFGYGKILNTSGNIAEVYFEKAGTKKVLSDYLEFC
jgi:DNA helicase-2/ATP-dependent DNA helicase PcrA